MAEDPQDGESAESLVRTNGAVGVFQSLEFAIEFSDGERKGADLIKLLGIGTVGAFDLAVELGGTGRQGKEPDAALLASLLEDSANLLPQMRVRFGGLLQEFQFSFVDERAGSYKPFRSWRGKLPVLSLLQIHPYVSDSRLRAL